jgi:hypothetical protein
VSKEPPVIAQDDGFFGLPSPPYMYIRCHRFLVILYLFRWDFPRFSTAKLILETSVFSIPAVAHSWEFKSKTQMDFKKGYNMHLKM